MKSRLPTLHRPLLILIFIITNVIININHDHILFINYDSQFKLRASCLICIHFIIYTKCIYNVLITSFHLNLQIATNVKNNSIRAVGDKSHIQNFKRKLLHHTKLIEQTDVDRVTREVCVSASNPFVIVVYHNPPSFGGKSVSYGINHMSS